MAGLWLTLGLSDVEHVRVRILEAQYVDNKGRVELVVDSCNGAPRATFDRDGEVLDVEVKAFRFRRDTDACLDLVEIFLDPASGPLPTELVDTSSGEVVVILRP